MVLPHTRGDSYRENATSDVRSGFSTYKDKYDFNQSVRIKNEVEIRKDTEKFYLLLNGPVSPPCEYQLSKL